MPDQKTLIVVVGPTAIGKTALGIKIAREFNTEIISADSRQFYREMNIGTAKPSMEELAQVKHHFINSHSIVEDFSVGDFEKQGLQTLNKIFLQHQAAVLVGGSGLYVNAICSGFDSLPKVPPEIREKLNQLYAEQGIDALQQMLKKLDPDYFDKVDIQNPQRLIRALEVCLFTGVPFSAFRTSLKKTRPFNIIKIGLNTSREQLYKEVNQRVDQMIANGLIAEVKSLLPYRNLNALNTVGYAELFDYFDDNHDLDTAIAKIKQNTRRFAKRQLTWFKKDEEIKWFEPDEWEAINCHINKQLLTPAP